MNSIQTAAAATRHVLVQRKTGAQIIKKLIAIGQKKWVTDETETGKSQYSESTYIAVVSLLAFLDEARRSGALFAVPFPAITRQWWQKYGSVVRVRGQRLYGSESRPAFKKYKSRALGALRRVCIGVTEV